MRGEIKYSYCLDENNKLIDIKSLSSATRHVHRLYCLSCGQEMVANLGTKKEWYFSHKADCACNGETYLHKLAKRRIKEVFMTKQSFPVSFLRDIPCSEKGKCPFYNSSYCNEKDVSIPSDLKLWNNRIIYDTCTEEIKVEEFRPDLLLTNSQNSKKEPTFIEINNTHKSSDAKIKSSYRIIETIPISESVIDDIICRGFVEGSNCKMYNFKPQLPSIRKQDVAIERFVLFNSGSCFVHNAWDYEIYCDNVYRNIRSNSKIELNIRNRTIYGPVIINDLDIALSSLQKGLIYLVKKGWDIKNCNLCKYYKYNEYTSSYICILYKTLMLQSPTPKQTIANKCQRFEYNQKLLDYPILELEKEVFELPDKE